MAIKRLSLYFILGFGIFAGMISITVGLLGDNPYFPVTAGAAVLILSANLFLLKKWARRAALIVSAAILVIYLGVGIATYYVNLFIGIALVFHFPLAVWSLINIFYLLRRSTKVLFESNPAQSRFHKQCLFLLIIPVLGMVFYSNFERKPRFGSPMFSPDGQYLLFDIEQNKMRGIYRCRIDGSGLERLTPYHEDNFDPAYSPDGSKIVFVEKKGPKTHLCLMDSEGSHKVLLPQDPADDSKPVFSSDGKRIYFVRAHWKGGALREGVASWHGKGICSVNIDGSNLKVLVEGVYDDISKPSVSPDGKNLAAQMSVYRNPDSLWLIPLASPKEMIPIRPKLQTYHYQGMPYQPAQNYVTYDHLYEPRFSPNGENMLFQWVADSNSQGYFSYEIFEMNMETKAVERLTRLERHASNTSFSSDGQKLVFLFEPRWPKSGQTNQIWIMNSDGGKPHRVDIEF